MSAGVVLHIGPPKTGSTYLQNILWRNRDALRRQGLEYPAAHDNEHFLAAYDVQGGAFVHADLPEADGTWEQVVARVHDYPGRSLISHEILALSRPRHIQRIVESLHPARVDVVVMGRCLADVLPSIYQEKVKQRDPEVSWPGFLRGCRRPAGMWGQRLGPLIARWKTARQVLVVTVPVPTAPRRRLLDRFGDALDIDVTGLDVGDADTNESLDAVDVVLLQQLLRRTRATLSWHEHRDPMSRLVPALRAADRPRRRLRMPASSRAWMQQEAAESIRAIEESGCRVYGDLADLLPRSDCFGVDDSGLEAVSADEVLEPALEALRTALAAASDS